MYMGCLDGVAGFVQRVAVKVPKDTAHITAQDRRKVKEELEIHWAAFRQCPNSVCKLAGGCEKDGIPCVVMVCYGGGTLAQKIDSYGGPLPCKLVWRYARRLCSALKDLHWVCGIILRDIKPANVLLNDSDVPCFSDLGLSRKLQEGEDSYMTRSGAGTTSYSAPENFDQARLGGIGFAADIWSMGCLIAEMHTGEAPWARSGYKREQIIAAVLKGKQPSSFKTLLHAEARRDKKQVYQDLPRWWLDLLKECFRCHPRDRPTAPLLYAACAALYPNVCYVC